MSIAAGAPAIITQLSTQLSACASWAGTNWYPKAPKGTAVPYALLVDNSSIQDTVAVSTSVYSGELQIDLHVDTSIEAIETLGRAIKDELLAQPQGITFRSIEVNLAQDVRPTDVAGGESSLAISLFITYGLGT